LLRLGLERGKTAYESLEVITNLLAQFGQGGNCGFQHAMYYHNSYLLADPREAWVLETAGPHWAARQVKGVYTISNRLSLGKEFDLSSPDLVDFAVNKGWCKGRGDFDFAGCYSDFLYTRFSGSHHRSCRTRDGLTPQRGKISVASVMLALRDHGDAPSWNPGDGITGSQVCMHASFGPVRASQSVGSMVSHLHQDHPAHFFTATSAPCTSLFKPVWLDAGLPDIGPEPKGKFDGDTIFWRHERLHRATLRNYQSLIQCYQTERDDLERQFVEQALELAATPVGKRLDFSGLCFKDAEIAESRWLELVQQDKQENNQSFLHKLAWDGFNRQANIPD
jgi:dipeptidase